METIMETIMTNKCEALKANKGKGWSLFAICESDAVNYHQCGQPASIRVTNEYWRNETDPQKIYLCEECDILSRV
jgi:hypothetical protein